MEQEEVKQPDAKQREKLSEIWGNTGLLEGIQNRYQRSAVAVMLENQRLVNEMLMSNGKSDPRLTKMSIPFVRRVFGRSDLFNIVSVQPLLTPTGMAMVLDGYGIPRSYEIPSRPMRLTPPVPDPEEDADLEKDVEVVAKLSAEYTQHITRHVLQDLRNAAGIQLNHIYRSAEDLVAYIKMANGKIVREMGGRATWVVVSPSIAYEIIEVETDFQLFDVPDYIRKDIDFYKFGLWNKRWTVYVDPLAPTTSVVMGHKGEHYHQVGYVFSPYVLYSQGVREGDSTNIISLIGKRLVYPGFYASINVGNYSITEIEGENHEEFLDRTEKEGRTISEEQSGHSLQGLPDVAGVRSGDSEADEEWTEGATIGESCTGSGAEESDAVRDGRGSDDSQCGLSKVNESYESGGTEEEKAVGDSPDDGDND